MSNRLAPDALCGDGSHWYGSHCWMECAYFRNLESMPCRPRTDNDLYQPRPERMVTADSFRFIWLIYNIQPDDILKPFY